jgi:pimeloyl-ACP methyl ester carboxylesterase
MDHTRIRSGFVPTSEGRIHYATAGAGDPLVLLPHGVRTSEMYEGIIPILAATSTVFALDRPGTGRSFRPPAFRSIPQLAEILHEAATAAAGRRFAVYGMNGGNKLGAAMAAAHPESVTGFIFAGLTHSIVLSNEARERTLGSHPDVSAFLKSTDPAEDARRQFYQAVTTYDLEATLRSLRVPAAVLEFATQAEDASIGRQGKQLAAEIGAVAHAVIELQPGAPVSLEDRPEDLAAAILALRAAWTTA